MNISSTKISFCGSSSFYNCSAKKEKEEAMRERIGKCICLVAAMAMISACGGGGSSSSGGGGGDATPVSKTVSGTAVISEAAASKAAVQLDGAAVEVVSYDKSGKELGRAVMTTDTTGGFAAQLPLLASGYVVVQATKEGFTQYQKRIEVDSTTPGDIEVQAAVDRVAFTREITIDPASATTIGKSSEASFNFAIIRYANGTKKAVAGKSAILAAKSAADATLEMGISIPAASLPGVASINAKASTFDPASNSLPGSNTATDSSGKEGKMVSLAFDYLNLTATGTDGATKNLGKVAQALIKAGVKKSAYKTTTYTRYIYSNSCDNLFLEDYNKTAAGHQVPVWSLRSSTGKWVYIGEGTVTDSSNNPITAPTAASCKTDGYYLTIQVSNTEFQNNYWNLDHIVFSTPTKICLSGTFTDGTNPMANMSLTLSGNNLDNAWGYTAANGKYTIETVLLNSSSTASNAKLGKLSFYDAVSGYNSTDVDLSGVVYPACKQLDKTLQAPCTVSGKLVGDDGITGVPYRSLSLVSSTAGFYKGVGTGSDGSFSSKVKCGEPIKVYSGGATELASFTVNGVTTAGETSDDSTAVVLNNITTPNMAPNGYAYFANSSINLLKTSALTAYISGYDGDNNYPLSYTLTIGSTVKTGTISASDPQPITVSIAGLTVGDYNATFELKDSKDASSGVKNIGKVYVSSGNRAPVTQLYTSTNYIKACGSNRDATLYGWAFDPDGDAMTGAWSLTGGTAPSATSCPGGQSLAGISLSAACKTTLPQGSGPFVYNYTASDSATSAGVASVSISTYNNPPVVTLRSDKNLVPEGSTGAARVVTLTATAQDPDSDAIASSAWYVDNTALTCTGLTCSYTIPDTATKDQIFTFKYTASDCAATGSNTVKVVYGQSADVKIVVE